jgi:hypothetical protein
MYYTSNLRVVKPGVPQGRGLISRAGKFLPEAGLQSATVERICRA